MKFTQIVAVGVTGFLLSSVAAIAAPAPDSETIVVGGREIRIPAPAGFERIDGKDPEDDRIMEAALPPANRSLARFESASQTADKNSGPDRSFNIQILRALENREIGERTFADLREETKAELEAMKATIAKTVDQVGKDSGKQLSKELGERAALEFSDVVMLGLFDDSEHSLGFSMAMNIRASVGDSESKSQNVTASMVVPVNGRMLFLYALSDYRTEEDRLWAENAVTKWKDEVVASNDRLEGPAGKTRFTGKETLAGAITGGCIGAVAGLIGWRIMSRKKKDPTTP